MIKILKNIITLFLAFIFVTNIFVIVKNCLVKDDIPSFCGYSTFLVRSEDIRGKNGDIDYVIVKKVDADNLIPGENGDVTVFNHDNSFTVARLVLISYVGNNRYYNFSTYDKKYSYSNIDGSQIIGTSVIVIYGFGKLIMLMKSYYKIIMSVVVTLELLIISLIFKNNLLKKGKAYEQ